MEVKLDAGRARTFCSPCCLPASRGDQQRARCYPTPERMDRVSEKDRLLSRAYQLGRALASIHSARPVQTFTSSLIGDLLPSPLLGSHCVDWGSLPCSVFHGAYFLSRACFDEHGTLLSVPGAEHACIEAAAPCILDISLTIVDLGCDETTYCQGRGNMEESASSPHVSPHSGPCPAAHTIGAFASGYASARNLSEAECEGVCVLVVSMSGGRVALHDVHAGLHGLRCQRELFDLDGIGDDSQIDHEDEETEDTLCATADVSNVNRWDSKMESGVTRKVNRVASPCEDQDMHRSSLGGGLGKERTLGWLAHEDRRGQPQLSSPIAYLNGAACSPLPRSSLLDGTRCMRAKLRPWLLSNTAPTAEAVRTLFAGLLGAKDGADSIAITWSTSYALSLAAHLLPQQSGRRAVCLQGQMASNVLPWQAWTERNGSTLLVVPSPGPEGDWARAVEAAIEREGGAEKIGVIAVPACHWCDGSLVDLPRLGSFCKQVCGCLQVYMHVDN